MDHWHSVFARAPAALVYIIMAPGNMSPNDRATVMIWGTLLVLFISPIAGAIGFFGGWLGNVMTRGRR
jgi:hypothetical protein